MEISSAALTTAAPVAVEKARRAPSPRRHRLEENPPPPIRAFSVDQIEAEHPGIKGRLPSWVKRADAGDPAFAWLRFAIIRIGRSVFIDDVRFRDGLHQHTAMPPAPSRRGTADKVAASFKHAATRAEADSTVNGLDLSDEFPRAGAIDIKGVEPRRRGRHSQHPTRKVRAK